MKQAKLKKVTEEQVIAAIEDINNVCEYDPAISTEGGKKALVTQLEKRVSDKEDALQDDDFELGTKAGLKTATVELLVLLEVKGTPSTWSGRLEEEAEKAAAAEKEAKTEKKPKADKKAEASKDKPKADKKAKTEKKPKADKKPSQTDILRDLIRSGKSKEDVIECLAKKFDKTPAWALNRVKMYENAYGEMGKDDKKL
jgi:septum formation inhibitor MinC